MARAHLIRFANATLPRDRFDHAAADNSDPAHWGANVSGAWAQVGLAAIVLPATPGDETLLLKTPPLLNLFATHAAAPTGRQARKQPWFVTFAVDTADAEPAPPVGHAIDVDLGVTDFAVTNNGQRVANPKHLERKARKPGPLPADDGCAIVRDVIITLGFGPNRRYPCLRHPEQPHDS